jgi:hypothetical protein
VRALCAGFAAAGALALAGCGGGGDPETPSEPPAELLRTAIENPAQSGESRIVFATQLEGDSLLAGDAGATLDGPFALDQAGGLPSFDLALDGEVAGFGVDGQLVSTGDDAFVVFFGQNYRVGTGRVASIEQQLASAGAGGGAAGLGLDVASWFEQPRYAGSEEVAGTETERIEGTLDGAAAAEDLSALAASLGAPALIEALAAGAGPGPIEAWVAYDDKTIRRLRVQFPFTVPPAQRASALGVGSGDVSFEAEISDVGAEVAVEPPPGGGFRPVEQLIARLQGLASLAGL